MATERKRSLSLSEFLSLKFGTTTFTPTPRIVSVGGTEIEVLAQNPNRLGALIVNLGAGTVYLSTIRPPTTSVGIRLAPNGGNLTLTPDEDFSLVGYSWTGINGANPSDVLVLEILSA